MIAISEACDTELVLPVSAVEEAKILYSGIDRAYGKNFFSVNFIDQETQKFKSRYHSLSSLESVCKALQNQKDHYVSQATFVSRSRRQGQLSHITSLFVDLDLYNLGLPNNDATLHLILKHGADVGLPEPSLVTSSGRGMYLRWFLSHPLSSERLPAWRAANSVLCNAFTSFAADKKVKDASRVLRVTGSINTKAEGETALVRQIWCSQKRHNFEQFAATLCGIDFNALLKSSSSAKLTERNARLRMKSTAQAQQALGQARGDLGALMEFSSCHEPIMLKRGTLPHLNWSRFLDLRDLAISRGGIQPGMRDNYLFWMASTLALSKIVDEENFWGEMEPVMRAMPGYGVDFNPKEDGSMSTLLAKITDNGKHKKIKFDGFQYNPIYTASNDYLINIFEINDEEMSRMRTLISYSEKQRRADLKVPGRAERRIERCSKQQQAVDMRTQGATLHAIASAMKVHKSTVSRWLAPVEKEEIPGPQPLARGPNAGLLRKKQALIDRSEPGAEKSKTSARKAKTTPLTQSPVSHGAEAAPPHLVNPSKSGLESPGPTLDKPMSHWVTLPPEAAHLKLFEPPQAPDIPSLNQTVLAVMRARGLPITPEVEARFLRPLDFASLTECEIQDPVLLDEIRVEQMLATERHASLLKEAEGWRQELSASLKMEKFRLNLVRGGQLPAADAVIRDKVAAVISGATYHARVSQVEADLAQKRQKLLDLAQKERHSPTPVTVRSTPVQTFDRHLSALKRRVTEKGYIAADPDPNGLSETDEHLNASSPYERPH